MSGMVAKNLIYTGDTTTHGGILIEGCENDTRNGKHFSVLVGHKFWCPKCLCWSTFVEGCSRYTVHGKKRVLEGHRSSCGAEAIHILGFNDTCEDDGYSSRSSEVENYLSTREKARGNQSKQGGYSHSFGINHNSESPLGYIIFNNAGLLDIGKAGKNNHRGGTFSKVTTKQEEKIYLAVQAPRPEIK